MEGYVLYGLARGKQTVRMNRKQTQDCYLGFSQFAGDGDLIREDLKAAYELAFEEEFPL